MKTQRRRGFTVVELVVVIAIIAVLAAVLIPTFASIIKKANDSAYLQERTNQQIADLAEKVEKINYFTWEDFEKKLAEELAKMPSTSDEAIKAAVTAAMQQYQGEHAGQNTGLTEDQVTKNVNEAMKGQLTTAQVEAIVNQAVSKIGGVNVADVQAIVKSAIAGMGQTGLNASQVKAQIAAVLANSNLANKEAVEDAIAKALAKIENLTAEEVQAIVSTAVSSAITESKPSASTVYIAGDMELAADITYILRTMNTINSVTLTVPDGVTVTKIIIDAPNVYDVQIVGAGTVDSVEIQSTAMMSTHIRVNVTNVVVNKGRAVVEGGATVTTLTAAPSTNATVTVVIEGNVSELNSQYQNNGTGTNDYIEIINAGTVGTANLTASTALQQSGTTTTNLVVVNVGDTNQASNAATSAENLQSNANSNIPEEAKNTVAVVESNTVEVANEVAVSVTHYPAKAATCTEAGNSAYYTYVDENGETIKVGYTEIEALNHDVNMETGVCNRCNEQVYVYKVGNSLYKSSQFSSAWAAAKNSSNAFKILSDLTINAIPADGKFTIDLNGHTLTLRGHSSTSGAIRVYGLTDYDGDLTIRNGTLNMPGTNYNNYGIYSEGNLTIEDVTINSACKTVVYVDGLAWNTVGTANLTNVVINSTNSSGTAYNAHSVSMYGTIYSPVSNLNNVTINSSYNGVMINATNANLHDCTITAAENCAWIIFSATGNTTGTMTISGETTINANSSYKMLNAQDGNTIVVEAGTYNFDPTAYVASGYSANDNGDGTWTVVQSNSIGPISVDPIEDTEEEF